MNADWAGVLATILIATATGGWAVTRWSAEGRADRIQSRQLTDVLYLNPFLSAADDLQSRLFNLLDRQGLVPLRARDPRGRYAAETMFLLARYFAWEQQLLRFTHLAADAEIVRATRTVRTVLSSDRIGLDPWCLFKTVQTALGQSVVVWRQGETGFADTISFVEFERLLLAGLADDLGLGEALEKLRGATSIEDLDAGSRRRLANLQASIVALLEAIDERLRSARRAPAVVPRDRSRSAVSDEMRGATA